ncbi:iron-containing alcohol dehydrogenase [Candidatus Pelagibacter sp.]|jgi:alcohol dehydrogenase class IV|uniref:iron-containing alcohol dehydrogenase n=1 Tax=Candidatus Pelagibacter sp. Uisw_094 TaxID=3230980 RepID=UPI00232533E9|nr:iron-containing alcohol dehydrogenase [Candidatus Pelagibacter sp.]MDB9935860.1 iron-containing alcohol dehydrogenase [Candidatus Pelagibacter sp.]|tara:strand:- start:3529 stop:4701 length:1173 start_codon:yes stop_codon:yes gene_type:complete
MSLDNFIFNTTSGIRFGSGMSKLCAEEVSKKLGPNILFITDKDLMSLKLTEPSLNELRKYSSIVEIFQDVEADPSIKTLLNSIEVGKKINATGVIGFGGGSSMDVAKLSALILGSNENIEDVWGVSNAKGPRLPLVLVPTTAGTGSEVTPISIITVGEEEKKGVSSAIILPDIAILDPDLTIGLPAHTTAATGIDAMVHAIEGYTSANKNNNPISKMLAVEALKLLACSIERAVFDGSDIEARGNMLIGAMLAGKAFANSPVAAVHALAYPIGGTFHVSHGLSNSLVLPYVLRFNSVDSKTTKNYAELAPFIFPDINTDQGSQAICKEFIDKLEVLSKKIGLPQKLREVNIPKDACKKMASDAMKQTRLLVNNPREMTESDALNIYEAAW